jgi:hypothetical protein
MAFEWIQEIPEWQKEAAEVMIGLILCMVIAIPMFRIKHAAALKAAQGKMD